MTAAPKGLSKSADENEDAVANASAKPRAQRTKTEQEKVEKAIDSKDTTDAKAKVTTGSPAEGEVLPKAEPEAVSTPEDTREGEEDEGEAQFDVVPALGEPVPDGKVQVTRKAEKGEPSDPGGNVSEIAKTGKRRAPKKDALTEISDFGKLPLAVTVGQITASVEEYAGRPVLSLSLVGWVGDAPLKILAADVGEVEQALAELRSQLS